MAKPLKSPFSYPDEFRELVEAVFLTERTHTVEFDSPAQAHSFRTTFYAFVRSAENAIFVENKLNLTEEEKRRLAEIYRQARQVSCRVEGATAVMQAKSSMPYAEAMRKAIEAGPKGEAPRSTGSRDQEEAQALIARLEARAARKAQK